MTAPARIRLRLLGRPVLTRGDDPAPLRLSTRKVRALLAYLAMSADQAASREELATLLWGECSDQQARQSLRQALAFLRKGLGSPDFLTADTDMVRLARGLWSVDALEFEELSKSSDRNGQHGRAARSGGRGAARSHSDCDPAVRRGRCRPAADPLLADMITDDLGRTLSRAQGLRVISRQTSRTYRADADPVAAGTELGVRYVLRGQVTATAGIGVAVELIDAKSGAKVWSQRFQRDGDDRVAIQDEVVNGLGRDTR
jgi:hypothetical protein